MLSPPPAEGSNPSTEPTTKGKESLGKASVTPAHAGSPVPEPEATKSKVRKQPPKSSNDSRGSGTKKKRKKTKDPDAPKNPLSAYLFFVVKQRSEMSPSDSELDFREMAKKIGKIWRGMSKDEKQPYVQLAEYDKTRYEKEKRMYKEKLDSRKKMQSSMMGGPLGPRRYQVLKTYQPELIDQYPGGYLPQYHHQIPALPVHDPKYSYHLPQGGRLQHLDPTSYERFGGEMARRQHGGVRHGGVHPSYISNLGYQMGMHREAKSNESLIAMERRFEQPQYMRAPYGRGPSYVEGIRYYGQPPNHSQAQTIPVGGIEAQMHLHGLYPAYKLYGSNLGEGRIRQPLPQQQHPNQLLLNPGMGPYRGLQKVQGQASSNSGSGIQPPQGRIIRQQPPTLLRNVEPVSVNSRFRVSPNVGASYQQRSLHPQVQHSPQPLPTSTYIPGSHSYSNSNHYTKSIRQPPPMKKGNSHGSRLEDKGK
mmetsp:Transcript_18723/g.30896  ORF Transcript_18723/g.30896 Transcript_18723/m.30896 type:complete len:476 (-) Transcript_18723:197-1624(-)